MTLDIYQKVIEIIGVVPPGHEYVYAIGAIILFFTIVYCLIWPWKMLFD